MTAQAQQCRAHAMTYLFRRAAQDRGLPCLERVTGNEREERLG